MPRKKRKIRKRARVPTSTGKKENDPIISHLRRKESRKSRNHKRDRKVFSNLKTGSGPPKLLGSALVAEKKETPPCPRPDREKKG